MKKLFNAALSALLALSLSACGSSGSAAGTESGSSTTAASSEPVATVAATEGKTEGEKAAGQVDKITVALTNNSFETGPFGKPSGARDWFNTNLYATLYYAPYFGATIDELQPWVAKSMTKIDDLTYEFEIRDNVVDSKGNKITTEDIIWSTEQLAKVAEDTTIANNVESMEAIDETHMRIKLKFLGEGVLEGVIAGYRQGYVSKSWYESASDDEKVNNPATTGPYVITSYTPSAQLVLEAKDDYWLKDDGSEDFPNGAKQNVKQINYTCITEAAMRSIALENKEIDVTQVAASELKRFYENGAAIGDWNVLINGGNMYSAIFLNMDENSTSPLATDENLRKAVLYSINPEDILFATGANLTTGKVVNSLGTPSMSGYNTAWDDNPAYGYDPAKAKECYEASGHKPGEVTVRFLSRTTTGDSVHSVFLAQLQEAGFNVELLDFDQALFNQYKFDSTQWDIIYDSKGASGPITSGWDNLFNPAGYSNGSVCFTHDDKLVELVQKAFQSGDAADIEEANTYINELALGKGISMSLKFTVGQSGILELTPTSCFNPCVNAYVFAADYKSVK